MSVPHSLCTRGRGRSSQEKLKKLISKCREQLMNGVGTRVLLIIVRKTRILTCAVVPVTRLPLPPQRRPICVDKKFKFLKHSSRTHMRE